MSHFCLYLLVLAVALVASLVLTPCCRALAWRWNFLDRPLGQDHKQHGRATPLLGGLAMMAAWVLTVDGGALVGRILRPQLPADWAAAASGLGAAHVWPLLGVITGGAVALGVMGLVDDRKPMGPGLKFALQFIICGIVAAYPRLQITLFVNQPVLVWLITLGWYVFLVNAFNFFDNMDGLAAGVALIASGLFLVVAALQGQVLVALLAAATAGTALGFYVYNRNPASIFMGDSGSHFLGFLLAVQGSLTTFYTADSPSYAPVFIPLFILALPIFDTFAVVFIRWRQGRPVYTGDHNHNSHRFLRMGMTPKTAVLLVHLLALALGLSALPLLQLSTGFSFFVIAQAAVMLALISILHGINDRATRD